MPGLPLAVCDTTHHGCSQSRTADQMCHQQSRVHLTTEEQLAAEESLSIYCKPVELYNILQRRAIKNPLFLQRCLRYKIQAKMQRRIQITVSLIGNLNIEVEEKIFPLYVLLAKPIGNVAAGEHSTTYQLSRPWVLTNFAGYGKDGQTEARFVIPEVKKLASDGRASGLTIIIVSKDLEGCCLWGKLQVDTLCLSLEKCVTLSLGHRADMLSAVNMKHGILEPRYVDRSDCMVFHSPNDDATSTCQVQVSICAQEVGASEASPYDSYLYDDVPSSSLPHIIRLRTGNVLFNYRYYNNMLQKAEVTEDFSCPFCLVKCASFKGLRLHLTSCHDLFNFEFWVTEEYQAVNVSVRTDIWKSEVLLDGVDPRLQTFSYCSNFKRSGRSKNLVGTGSHVHPHTMESGSPEVALEGYHDSCNNNANITCSSRKPLACAMDVSLVNGCNDGFSYKGEGRGSKSHFNETRSLTIKNKSESLNSHNRRAPEGREPLSSSPEVGVYAAAAQASTSSEFAQQVSGSNLAPHNMLQFGKMRKISDDRADPRNRALLQKRQFFHSHRAQPMAMEQIFSDQDSEDEVDDDIADFEDRRFGVSSLKRNFGVKTSPRSLFYKMLDDFVDVTKDEKHIMHLWNSFVRKQRVLADGHIPWACEAFCRLHGPDLVRAPSLLRNWRLVMIKLWNHNLLDPRTFDNCSLILEKLQNETPRPSQS